MGLMKKLSLYIFLVLMWCNVGVAEDKIDKLINEKNLINKSLSEIKRKITALEVYIKKAKAKCEEERVTTSTLCWHIGDPQRDMIESLSKYQHEQETRLNKINKKIHFAKIELTQKQQVTESTLSECKGTNFAWWTYCKGTYTWSNGTKYVGGWKEGEMHGQGTYTFADGRVDKGIFEKGKLIERQE
jgi:hypothetical protein